MPYHIVKHDSRWCVEKADGSHKSMGCHDTEVAAKKQLAALYANEPKAARCLHLVGAMGNIRTAEFNSVEHLVVPVVAMVEGVVWAVNSDVPEFVSAEELAVSPQQWNGRGCFAGHPKDGGTQVTANTPRTLEQSFGVIFGASSADQILKTRRLELEAWLNPLKAQAVGPEAVDVIQRLRAYQANPSKAKPVEVSVGCYVEAELVTGSYNGLDYHGAWRNIVSDHLAFLGENQAGACSVAAGCGAPRTAVKHFVTAEGIRREEPIQVAPIPAPPKVTPKPAATTPHLRAAADCGCTGDKNMEKTTRAELIAALVMDKFSGFKEGDETILEAASDARLQEFRSASDANRSAANTIVKLETENRNVGARLKVAEERLKAAESPMTEEDFRARAPESIKTVLDAFKAEEDALRASLVSQLKDLGAHTEEQLKKKSITELQTLAAYARVEVPDFSGRGVPRLKAAEHANTEDFTPPEPYAAGLKAMQAHAGKAN